MLSIKILKYFLLLICLPFSFLFGLYFEELIFFNDDSSIKELLYSDSIEYLSKKNPKKEWIISKIYLERANADYFRTKSLDCIRFMPPNYSYNFVVTYCVNRENGIVEATHY